MQHGWKGSQPARSNKLKAGLYNNNPAALRVRQRHGVIL